LSWNIPVNKTLSVLSTTYLCDVLEVVVEKVLVRVAHTAVVPSQCDISEKIMIKIEKNKVNTEEINITLPH